MGPITQNNGITGPIISINKVKTLRKYEKNMERDEIHESDEQL
jgi:hypothetical protein